ncbi:MAG: hypothetical protein HQ481_18255 [Alphaproteobacteria bacterium]|nr:hypothetical protein [Alphaproteobacteria bacterium]
MSRNMWIIAALFAVLAIAMMYQDSTGGIERPWAQCKESMIQQMLFDECTPRTGGLRAPAQGDNGAAPSGPAPDDGAAKVDLGN